MMNLSRRFVLGGLTAGPIALVATGTEGKSMYDGKLITWEGDSIYHPKASMIVEAVQEMESEKRVILWSNDSSFVWTGYYYPESPKYTVQITDKTQNLDSRKEDEKWIDERGLRLLVQDRGYTFAMPLTKWGDLYYLVNADLPWEELAELQKLHHFSVFDYVQELMAEVKNV